MVSRRWQRLYARLVWLPTLSWNYLLGRVLKVRNWADRIDAHVIVGAYPFARDVRGLVRDGVRAVVNTCEEYAGPSVEYETAGVEQLRIPTTDFAHPRLEDVQAAVEFVQRHVSQGDTVYIHCKAGRARSATVALCWLVKYRGLTPVEAQELLLQRRPHVNRHLADRPVVKLFCEALEREISTKVTQ
jgi:atypical dual specificity phosphatase